MRVLISFLIVSLLCAGLPNAKAQDSNQQRVLIGTQTPIGNGCYDLRAGTQSIYVCIDRMNFSQGLVNKREGECEILLSITESGKVNAVTVLQSEPAEGRFRGACQTFPKNWRFTPPKMDSKQRSSVAAFYVKIVGGENADIFATEDVWMRGAQASFTLDAAGVNRIVHDYGESPTP